MQLILETNVKLDENEDKKYINIIHFQWDHKIDENAVIFVTWNVVHRQWTPHVFFSTWFAIMNPSCKCTCNYM